MGHGFLPPLWELSALGSLRSDPGCPCCFPVSTPEATLLERKHRCFLAFPSLSYPLAPEGLLPAERCARREAGEPEDESRGGSPSWASRGSRIHQPQMGRIGLWILLS